MINVIEDDGQSNNIGSCRIRALWNHHVMFSTVFTKVFIYTKPDTTSVDNGAWEPLNLLTNSTLPGRVGLANWIFGCAYEWERRMPASEPLYIIHYGSPGSGLAADGGAPDFAPASAELYTIKINGYSIPARAKLPAGERRELLLRHQGEADALSSTKAAAYATNLTAYMNAWRTAISAPASTPEIHCIIPEYYKLYLTSVGQATSQLDTVNNAIRARVAADTATRKQINCNSMPHKTDNVHLAANGQIQKGREVFRLARGLWGI